MIDHHLFFSITLHESTCIDNERLDTKPFNVLVGILIFLVFPEAAHAIQALNGRWFSGRKVLADFYEMSRYLQQDYSS